MSECVCVCAVVQCFQRSGHYKVEMLPYNKNDVIGQFNCCTA